MEKTSSSAQRSTLASLSEEELRTLVEEKNREIQAQKDLLWAKDEEIRLLKLEIASAATRGTEHRISAGYENIGAMGSASVNFLKAADDTASPRPTDTQSVIDDYMNLERGERAYKPPEIPL